MKKFRILIIITLLYVVVSKTIAFDTDFSFSPVSGTKMKLYCETPVYMMINGWSEKFNWFQAGISFDSNSITVITWLIHSEFPNGDNFISWSLYKVWWAMAGWYKVWILTWVSFKIITKENTASTNLSFVDKNENVPEFWLETTDDGVTLNGYDQWSRDILSSVGSVTYNFVALPCYPDTNQPIITNVSVNDGATNVSEDQVITFLTYDWNGSKKVSYWFAWNSTWDLSNYVATPNPSNVDNQEWVDSSKISVTVSCTTCSTPKSNVPAILDISNWDWDSSKNALTWDSERRWYNVSINPPFSYEIEKEITVKISVFDNPNEYWEIHTGTKTIKFNAPVAPTITRNYPSIDTFVSPSKNFAISFTVSDNWAWVDTWSIRISIPQIMSGEEILLSWYVYSWSDLNFELESWSAWLWNAWSYTVSFYPKEDFPVNTEITLNVEWSDLAWTSKEITSKFTTRPSCSFFGCVDSINIIWWSINQIFSGLALTVTWTNPNSPYPYLTWENHEVLMCGKDWSGTVIVGNIYLYDNEWNSLNNVLYTWSHLYLDIDNCDGKFCQKDPNIVYQNSNIDVLDLRCRCEK